MARVWNWQTWGRASDLIHQSDINGLIGAFGCPEQFRRKKEERATGGFTYENASGKLASGNATHAVIHRVCRSEAALAVVLAHPQTEQRIGDASIVASFDEEFDRERAGRVVDWYKTDGAKWRGECHAMIRGLFDDMHKHVAEVVLAECAFVYPLDGMWLTGAIDLVYRARLADGSTSTRLSFSDWKTGKQRPHQIDLDHGWQSGIYGNAMRDAWFVPFENVPREVDDAGRPVSHRDVVERVCVEIAEAWQRVIDEPEEQTAIEGEDPRDALALVVEKYGARKFDEYPERIRYVHLRDYIPYARKTTKKLDRPEEIAWAGLEEAGKVTFTKGDTRGPAWYHVNRSEADTPRLRHLLRAVVSWVRFGRFPAAPGEKCVRCKFKAPCLTDGYKPIGEEKKQLDLIRDELDGFDGLDEL